MPNSSLPAHLPKLPSSALRDPNHAAGTLDSPEDISKVSAHKECEYCHNGYSADSHTGFCATADTAAVFYVLAFTPAIHSHSKEYFCKLKLIWDTIQSVCVSASKR